MEPSFDPAIIVQALHTDDKGLRVAVKDCLDIAGQQTGLGSAAFTQAPPAVRDAAVVASLRSAGCAIVGKANMHELAYGMTGVNSFTGTPVNPRFPDRIVGGSSSGSAAAVAAGLVQFAIGTDTGGSIRLPAACCGIVGMKPTFGRIPRDGAAPATTTLDCIGPLAADVSMLIRAMTIFCPGFVEQVVPADLSLGLVTCAVDPVVQDTIDGALERSGAAVTPVQLALMSEAHHAALTIMGAEMAGEFGELLGSGQLGDDIEVRLAAACTITAEQVEQAERVRVEFVEQLDAVLDRHPILVLPTLPAIPLLLADAADGSAALRLSMLVRPFNLSGHPALTLPVATHDDLPAGIQLIGRRGADEGVCAAALWLEGAMR